MRTIAMSAAAAGLLRALLARAAVERDRILLTELRSTDWQSLTFIGERHRIQLRVSGPAGLTAPSEQAARAASAAQASDPASIRARNG